MEGTVVSLHGKQKRKSSYRSRTPRKAGYPTECHRRRAICTEAFHQCPFALTTGSKWRFLVLRLRSLEVTTPSWQVKSWTDWKVKSYWVCKKGKDTVKTVAPKDRERQASAGSDSILEQKLPQELEPRWENLNCNWWIAVCSLWSIMGVKIQLLCQWEALIFCKFYIPS